ncbi:MAG: hypothetical protein RID91_13065 [Azospirillaceae bacterium]
MSDPAGPGGIDRRADIDHFSPDPYAEPAPTAGHPNYMARDAGAAGMSKRTANAIEFGIIAFCLASLAFIVQPFSQDLFTVGAAAVVLGALAFNLIPFAKPGAPLKGVIKAAIIIAIILVVAVALALLVSWLYTLYLQASRP